MTSTTLSVLSASDHLCALLGIIPPTATSRFHQSPEETCIHTALYTYLQKEASGILSAPKGALRRRLTNWLDAYSRLTTPSHLPPLPMTAPRIWVQTMLKVAAIAQTHGLIGSAHAQHQDSVVRAGLTTQVPLGCVPRQDDSSPFVQQATELVDENVPYTNDFSALIPEFWITASAAGAERNPDAAPLLTIPALHTDDLVLRGTTRGWLRIAQTSIGAASQQELASVVEGLLASRSEDSSAAAGAGTE